MDNFYCGTNFEIAKKTAVQKKNVTCNQLTFFCNFRVGPTVKYVHNDESP